MGTWIIIIVFATSTGTHIFQWTDNNKTPARFKTEAACEKRVDEVMLLLDADTDVPAYVIGCKQVAAAAGGREA